MTSRFIVSRCRTALVTGGLTFLLPLSGLAADNAPPGALLDVKVLPDRYVAAGRPFADLAALEAWTRPMPIRVLRLDSCGPASAKPLLAAVERFHAVYGEGIHIRTLASGEPECASAAAQGSGAPAARMGRLPTDEEYYASDAFGRSMIP